MGAEGYEHSRMFAVTAAVLVLGCAGCTSVAADVRTFESTQWRVTAIDGRATPPNGEYRIEFRSGQISGRFGCNGWGGHYAVSGDTLTADQIISTMMACPEPAAGFESQGLAIVREPMRLSWSAGKTLTLSNRAGSIGLERWPR